MFKPTLVESQFMAKKDATPTTTLPALCGDSAREKLAAMEVPCTAPAVLEKLPDGLRDFVRNRISTEDQLAQPALPGMGESANLRVSYLKLLQPNSRNKTFRGNELPGGSVVGKTPLFIPKKKEMLEGFPFIALTAWQERVQSKFDKATEQTETFCQSADGVTPSMANSWGAKECKACPRFPKNRPDYDDDPNQDQRCKSIYNILGVGGDFKDFYVLTVKGKAIMPVYFRGFIPHFRTMVQDNLPYYAYTFMVGSAPSGQYFQYEIRNVIPTVQLPGYPSEDTYFTSDNDISPKLADQLLGNLQKIAQGYVDERQQAARDNVKAFLEMETPITTPETGNDEEDNLDDGAEGLD
jgi:hypothetical protein